MSPEPIVFLVDVDNTLLDNDRIQDDLKRHLEREFGRASRERYWAILEQLFAGDLSKAVRNGGKYRFTLDAWLPSEALRGELAESWQLKDNPLRAEIKLRKGIMFPERPGVMASREFVADDVVFSYKRIANSPKKIPTYFDHIEKVYAPDKHTVVFQFKEFNAEWDYRFGWGYYSAIVPKEVVDAGATCVIQPGGSMRDQEVIDAANERGVAMVFSGVRHFRH